MKQANIRKYAELMKELDLSALEVTEGEKKIRLERTMQASPVVVSAPASLPMADAQATPAAAKSATGKMITSPMVGVFYHAPAEDAQPFVKVGDTVKKGDVVGIIEAMKLMNEVISDCDGVIAEVLAPNASTVDFGMGLYRIE